jgi:drug/metabolite transporter (DMT)-like permease
VVSLMSGWLVLGERLTALQGLGVLGVLLGVAVTALAPKVTTWLTKRHTADTPAQA